MTGKGTTTKRIPSVLQKRYAIYFANALQNNIHLCWKLPITTYTLFRSPPPLSLICILENPLGYLILNN